ncbi:uncharacterized protein M2282_003261 [Variovorax boronicumulans]|uniref:radical SAM protein n=1 Tax=Variovorax boronicumulans TaxID=436515 RepID=UPI00247587BA|nr:radical SAM protein [Variovorax boronicumulans]MDH6168110.1 uncharacterized protein [Variovorax boronicumulans]
MTTPIYFSKRITADEVPASKFAINYLLVKLVSACNINCDYCYWFRDPDVLAGRLTMSNEVTKALAEKLQEHLTQHSIPRFEILFHGGEPLLFPKRRFLRLCETLKRIGTDCGTEISFSLTTNGTLIDDEWCALFCALNVAVTLSYDGPSHDKHRVQKDGGGTAASTVRGMRHLAKFGLSFGCLSVGDAAADPVEYYLHMKQLGIRHFDVLLPDASWTNSNVASIAPFLTGLFDHWYDHAESDGVSIRTFSAIIRGLLGLNTEVESYGYGPIITTTLLPSGALEPLDVLRSNGGGFTQTAVNILEHPLQSIRSDPNWLAIAYQSTDLCKKCKECRYSESCGGGFFPHRWSGTSFKNESRYCSDLQAIYDHIWNRIDEAYCFSQHAT